MRRARFVGTGRGSRMRCDLNPNPNAVRWQRITRRLKSETSKRQSTHNIHASNRSLGPACQQSDPKLTPHRSPHQGVPWRRAKPPRAACRWSTDIRSSPRPSSRHPRASEHLARASPPPDEAAKESTTASFSALGLVCSSKTMAGRESRKYSSTLESSQYVGSVLKVLLDHRR